MDKSEHCKKQLGFGAAVVKNLTQCITNANHKLYFDHFFTSCNLLELLAERKIATLLGFLYNLTKTKWKKERGNYDEAVSHDGKVALVKWYDNRPVVMASNFVGVGTMDEVQWWNKKEARFVKVSRPAVIKLYNELICLINLSVCTVLKFS